MHRYTATNDNYPLVYNTRKAMKEKQIAAKNAGNKKEVKRWKKAQLPYKKMLNALSGAMKDETNAAYDPRNNNCMDAMRYAVESIVKGDAFSFD